MFSNKCIGIRGWVRIGRLFCGSHVIRKYRGIPNNVEILEVHGENFYVLSNSDGGLMGVNNIYLSMLCSKMVYTCLSNGHHPEKYALALMEALFTV